MFPTTTPKLHRADQRIIHQTANAEGTYSNRDLPKSGATLHEDTTDVASYTYDASKREFVSFDTPKIAKIKAQYAQSKGLAGAFFWDVRRIPSPASSSDDLGSVSSDHRL